MESLAWTLASAPFVSRTISFLNKRKCEARGYPYLWMVLHIPSAIALLVRYYLMNEVDIPVVALFLLSTVALQYHQEAKRSPVYRATFRASILLHITIFVLAFTSQPHLRDSCIQFLWWFTTTRAAGTFLQFLPAATKTLSHRADLIVLGSALVSVWYADLSVGLYMLLVMSLLWVDQKLLGGENGLTEQAFVKS